MARFVQNGGSGNGSNGAGSNGAGSGSISSIWPETQKLVLQIQNGLGWLEEQQQQQLQGQMQQQQQQQHRVTADDVMQQLTQLSRYLCEMDAVANEAPLASQRNVMWTRRVKQLTDEHCALQRAFNKYVSSNQAAQQRITRMQLFGTDNDAKAGFGDGGSSVRLTDAYIHENESLTRSSALVDDLQGMGQDALRSLSRQRDTLKSAHRKLLNVANSLGLSSTILKLIERKTTLQKFTAYGCMVLSVIIIGLVYWYFKIYKGSVGAAAAASNNAGLI
jgi:Golgi SNAP receptor complex protein 2